MITISYIDILTLLIGTAEAKVKPNELTETCKRLNMVQIEYYNFFGDPLFNKGYNFLFKTESKENARLEVIEFDDYLLQSGFQIIYKPRIFFKRIDKDFSNLFNHLKNYYLNIFQNPNFEDIEMYEFYNNISQCYFNRSIVNRQHVLNFKVTNKEIWKKYNS